MQLSKYSIGVGDRFGMQARAQLSAIIEARSLALCVVPVWNKSNREHSIIGTGPLEQRAAVEEAIRDYAFTGEYHVDADHINMNNVEQFIEACDFFTLDVADFSGKAAEPQAIRDFLQRHQDLIGRRLDIEGVEGGLCASSEEAEAIAGKYLLAVQEAGRLYRHIAAQKGEGNFIAEVSMDETDLAQTPLDMLFILAAIADEGIPAQTIAPKFTGRFNKGVEYVGDLPQFEKEFNQDLAVIRYAVKKFDLPKNLKLSIHSGSDKFAIYPIMRAAIRKYDTGLHLKTAGTSWLEELIGMASVGADGLEMAQYIYAQAYERFDELCKPYATVIDIDTDKLPTPAEVNSWTAQQYCDALIHEQSNPAYNPNFRQMLHVAFKVAAELGENYLDMVNRYAAEIGENVCYNIFERHIKRIFC